MSAAEARRQERYRERYALNLCRFCEKQRRPDKTCCAGCLDRLRIEAKRRMEEQRERAVKNDKSLKRCVCGALLWTWQTKKHNCSDGTVAGKDPRQSNGGAWQS